MKELQVLQKLLGEADDHTHHVHSWLELSFPASGPLYEVRSTVTRVLRPGGVGLAPQVMEDYVAKEGIWSVIPVIPWFQNVLWDTAWASKPIIDTHINHVSAFTTLADLCFRHIVFKHPHSGDILTGWILRVQITAKKAVLQILFLTWAWQTVWYEIPLWELRDGAAFHREPFSQIPLDLMIPAFYQADLLVNLNLEDALALAEDTPNNAGPHSLFSQTRSVFDGVAEMVEELLET